MNTQSANTGGQPFRSDLLKVNTLDGRVPSEHEEQRAFIEVWRKAGFPRIFAIPNGGARGAREAARLKVEGVSRGVPDLFCPEWLLWIEFKKRKGGSMAKDQREWHSYLEGIGQTVIVPKGAHEAVEMVLEFINKT